MLRFSKVQKKLTKSDVALWCTAAKSAAAKDTNNNRPAYAGGGSSSSVDAINGALLWCRSAHKMFDMDSTKLESIAHLQSKLESLAASGGSHDGTSGHNGLKDLKGILEDLKTYGYEPVQFTQQAPDIEEIESYKDYEKEACREMRRALRICYEERELKK